MIHSHWLCYKQIYGSVFLFPFPFLFFQKAARRSRASRTHITAPRITECQSWRDPQGLPKVLHRHFTVEETGAQRGQETFWRSRSQCPAVWIAGLLSPRAQCGPPHLVIFQRGQKTVPGPGMSLSVRTQPQSPVQPENLKHFLPRVHGYF